MQNFSLFLLLDVRHEVFTPAEELTTEAVTETYAEASTDVYQDVTAPHPQVFPEIYTETYTDVYTETYTEVYTEHPEIQTEIVMVYPAETYTEVFTDVYEDVYQNEYRDQPAHENTGVDRKVSVANSEKAEKDVGEDARHQPGPDASKGRSSCCRSSFVVSLSENFEIWMKSLCIMIRAKQG